MNVSSVVNHFSTANKGFITTLGSTISAGAVTVPLTSVSGLTNGTIFVGLIEPGLANEQEFTGTVDTAGVQITGVKWTDGTNVDHTAGVTIVDYVAATDWNMNTKGLLVAHDQDGTLKAGAVDNAAVLASDVVTTAKILDRNVTEAKLTHRPSTYLFDHVASGCVWSGDAYGSTRVASMTSGVVYIAGQYLTVAAVTSRTFTASKDVYVGFIDAGNGTATVVYYDNTTNAASPSLATAGYTMLGAIIVVGATNIAAATSVNQGQETMVLPIASSIPYAVTDSLGNLICPRDPRRITLGYRQIISNVTATTVADATGLSVPVIVPSDKKIKIIFDSSSVADNLAVGAGNYSVFIMEGATQLSSVVVTSIGINFTKPHHREVEISPTAGLHTYKIQIASTSGTITLGAGSNSPTFIKVELV